MFRKLTSGILFVILMVLGVSMISAQVATVSTGTPALVRLSQESPINILAFSGNTGDLVQVTVIALQPQSSPRASLQSPTQQALTSTTLSADGNSGTLSFSLTESGAHSLLIGGNAGEYLVSLSTIPTSDAARIPYGSDQEIVVNHENQVFSINIPADGRASVSLSAGQFRDYVAQAFDETGQHIATISNTSFACVVIAPQSTLVLSTHHADIEGGIVLRVGADCGSGTTPSTTYSQAVIPPVNASSACAIQNSGPVNVRSGAGTNYDVIGQVAAGSSTPVIARANNEWVQVQAPFGIGYISVTVASLSGDCGNIPSVSENVEQPPVQSTQAPTQQAVETTVEPTEAPTEQAVEPTVEPTEAPTEQAVEPTIEPTEAPTEQAVEPTIEPTEQVTQQIAPTDVDYNANIERDGTIILSDYVSYPDGDREDSVFYRVDNLNNSVALPGGQATFTAVLICNGEGTQYIEMEAPGRGTYRCGDVFTRTVNFDSNNGVLRVRATGGTGTYVQWTLHISAPTVN